MVLVVSSGYETGPTQPGDRCTQGETDSERNFSRASRSAQPRAGNLCARRKGRFEETMRLASSFRQALSERYRRRMESKPQQNPAREMASIEWSVGGLGLGAAMPACPLLSESDARIAVAETRERCKPSASSALERNERWSRSRFDSDERSRPRWRARVHSRSTLARPQVLTDPSANAKRPGRFRNRAVRCLFADRGSATDQEITSSCAKTRRLPIRRDESRRAA